MRTRLAPSEPVRLRRRCRGTKRSGTRSRIGCSGRPWGTSTSSRSTWARSLGCPERSQTQGRRRHRSSPTGRHLGTVRARVARAAGDRRDPRRRGPIGRAGAVPTPRRPRRGASGWRLPVLHGCERDAADGVARRLRPGGGGVPERRRRAARRIRRRRRGRTRGREPPRLPDDAAERVAPRDPWGSRAALVEPGGPCGRRRVRRGLVLHRDGHGLSGRDRRRVRRRR